MSHEESVATGSPSQCSAVVSVVGPASSHNPRGGIWTSGSKDRAACASARGERSGHVSASAAPSCAGVRGCSSSSRRASAPTGSRSRPTNGAAHVGVLNSRMTIGSINGRSSNASVAVTRWMVLRIRAMRTALRRAIARDSVIGSKSCSRDHSAV